MDQKEFIFNLIKLAIQPLALPAEEQIKLHSGAVVTDELLLDFDHASAVLPGNYKDMLSGGQIIHLDKIRTKIDEIQNSDMNIFELSSLQNNELWEQLRQLGKDALKEFSLGPELPPNIKD